MTIHLTAQDTFNLYCDSINFGHLWFDYANEKVQESDDTVTSWSVDIRESNNETDDDPGEWVTVTHDVILRVLQEIADEKYKLSDEYRDQVRAIVYAQSNDDATDEQCQLDADSDDCIMQIAVLGEIIYG